MHKYFYTSDEVQLLFEGWKTTSGGSFAGSVLLVFLLSILHEFIKSYKMYKSSNDHGNPEATPLLAHSRNQIGLEEQQPKRYCFWHHVKSTLFYTGNLIFRYFLMLIAMKYNLGLFLAIVIGYTLGYFVSQPVCEHYLADKVTGERVRSYGSSDRVRDAHAVIL